MTDDEQDPAVRPKSTERTRRHRAKLAQQRRVRAVAAAAGLELAWRPGEWQLLVTQDGGRVAASADELDELEAALRSVSA